MVTPSRLRPWHLLALFLALLLTLPLAASKEKEIDKQVKALPQKYQDWVAAVDTLLGPSELEAFLVLKEDYQRDAFIDRFWRSRDPYPDTARNEFRDRFEQLLQLVKVTFPNPRDERARLMLLNGEPADRRKIECSTLLYPTEVWYYSGSDRARYDFFLVFYRRWGGQIWYVWRPDEGLAALFQQRTGISDPPPSQLLAEIQNTCYRGDEVAAIFANILNQGILGYDFVLNEVSTKPKPPNEEWISTFGAYSTDVPPEAALLPAKLDYNYPGRRQSRTVLQGLVSVPVAQAGLAALADFRSYNFVLNGEVLAGEELFDSFRYKFDLPAAEVAGETLPLVFQRLLRPGSYRIVLKVEDLNGRKFFRDDRTLEVPALTANEPPPPADAESARLLAEANATIAAGDTTLKLVPPVGDLLSGMRRVDARVTGTGIDRVTFRLDGREILSKKAPPYSVELDLGNLPRPRTLSAIALDRAGKELASDELILNASSHRFAVRLTEPRRGASYAESLIARAEIEVPEGRSVERVEFFLDETKIATLFQPPWEQAIVLPKKSALSYVQAVAYLPDGNSTGDLVFINAPDLIEEMTIQFVELYTSVLDRAKRPTLGLGEESFKVFEDGVPQEIRRFERVDDLPIHAEVLLDVSASMEPRLEETKQAALAFFQQILKPKDRAALVTFNDRPALAAKFTNELGALAGGLAGLKAERGTALYDSLIFGLYYFNGIKGQRALLLLSDGKDESSRFKYEDALEYARRAGVTIHAIGLSLPKGEARTHLGRIAEETGGRAFFIDSPAELKAIYAEIERELRSQYLIAYQSSNTARGNKFREVEVKVNRSDLEAKTIRGYYP